MSSNMPPDVPGNASPHSLLSSHEMVILQEHYRLTRGCKTAEAREKALKGWTDAQLGVVKGLYDRLLAHGFVVDGQLESGEIRFGWRLKTELQQVMELSDADYRDYRAGLIVFDKGSRRLCRRRVGDAVES